MRVYKDLYKKLSDITSTNFKIEDNDDNFYYFNEDEVNTMIEELISQVERKEKEINKLKLDIEWNMKPIPEKEQYEAYDD